jgi:hypothetical protein
MKKLITIQFYILLLGTLFSWYNLTIEFIDWINNRTCSLGCSAAGQVVSPFLTPCFYGALFFLLAFIVSSLILSKFNKNNKNK